MTDRIIQELLSRRTVTTLAAAGVSLPVLAACGDDGSKQADASGDGVLGSPSDIEVGGGTIFGDEGVVVTQPTEGEFRGFDATCTHQGCQVSDVTDGTIHCKCHNSRFSIEDGSPQSGPATRPLKEVSITVSGNKIELA